MMIMDSSKPLYLQVKADIKNRILSKQYMPGDKLPTENELSDQYNVSKITIRKAIQNLSDEGYVNKVQGKGTFINFKKDKLYLNKTSGFKESLSSLGHASRHDIIQASFLNADEDIAEKLMIPMGTKVVYIERLVWQDNEPIAIDKIYIEDARFPDFITTLSKDRSFYQVMDECTIDGATLSSSMPISTKRSVRVVSAPSSPQMPAHLPALCAPSMVI